MDRIGIVFDCDGTLLDSMGVWRELEAELARRAHATVTPKDTEILCTLNVPESAQYFHDRFGLGESGADVERMMDEFILGYYRERAEARPGALAFVRALAERGVARSVAHAGLAPYLEAVVSVEDVGSTKREPHVYDHACKLMGTSLEFTWGFEDSIYAVRTLANAGYGVVGVFDRDDSGTMEELEAESDLVIRSFEDLDPDAFCKAVRERAARLR